MNGCIIRSWSIDTTDKIDLTGGYLKRLNMIRIIFKDNPIETNK